MEISEKIKKWKDHATSIKSAILEIDVQGGLAVKKIFPDAILVFVLPPSQVDLSDRMTGRARGEDDETTKLRLANADRETATAWQYYDCMIVNAEIQEAVKEITGIIEGTCGEKK